MHMLLFLMGLWTPAAHATLDSLGQTEPGVAQMWQDIRSVLFTNADPVAAITSATLNFVFPLIGAAAVLMVLYAGLKMIMGQGKDESISNAKDIIYHALLGMVLGMLATAIVGYFFVYFFPTLFQ